MKENIFIILFCVLFQSAQSISAQPISESQPNNGEHTALRFWNDLKYISTTSFSPARYPNWRILSYAGLTTIFLLGNDSEFHEEYGLEKQYGPLGLPGILGNIGTIYDKPGTLYFTLGLAGTMYGSGKIFNNYKLQQTTSMMARSLIITGMFTTALKVIIGRARPYVNNDPHKFKPFNFKFNPDYMSMPSGHTSSIFAMMTVLAKQYDSWYVKLPAYTFGMSVVFQRMNNQKHWGSDLLIGGTIGYLVGSTVVKRYRFKTGVFDIQPVFNAQGVGISIRM